jgi:hypothetical protein
VSFALSRGDFLTSSALREVSRLDSTLVVVVVLAAAAAWPASRMAWRMAQPIPQDDRVAIERAFEGRGPRTPQIAKRWIGGPWRRFSRRLPFARPVGRPYRVRIAGGSNLVAIDGLDSRGQPVVRLRDASGWKTVHKARAAPPRADDDGDAGAGAGAEADAEAAD